MMNLEDTIAAISTPLGEGGIAIVRLSGKKAIEIAEKVFRPKKERALHTVRSHSMLYGHIIETGTETVIDEVLLSVMKAPHTYTREDVVEINCHGGMLPTRKVLETVLQAGARLAEPGEFTFRAFMNGRIDLSQAEATIDLIRAKTERSGRIALEQLSGRLSEKITLYRDQVAEITAHIEAYIDFPEEELELDTKEEILGKIQEIVAALEALSATYEEGRLFREGLAVAIVGRPNVGKSSLLNALMERDRAIVTELPGTTRDVIEEYISINGIPVRIMDTAGIRETHDLAESEGVRRSLQAIEGADLILTVLDASVPLGKEDQYILERIKGRKSILVLNKTDLSQRLDEEGLPPDIPKVRISAKHGDGLEELKKAIEHSVVHDAAASEGIMITNLRHKQAIDTAKEALLRARAAIEASQPYEIIALELRDSLDRLGEIVGAVTTDDILNMIFSQFCIGK